MSSSGRPVSLRGFSLVELLVAICILGILAALLCAGLGVTKSRAKEAICLSNAKQICAGMQMYLSDHEGRYPAGIAWNGRFFNCNEFIGGKDPRLAALPPAQPRPLYPYLGASQAFRCPADVGYDDRTEGGPLIAPTLYDVAGVSYRYNGGATQQEWVTDGLGGKTLEWVLEPAKFMLLYEPPANGGRLSSPGSISVYWHRARKPGSEPFGADGSRGPRVAMLAFVDGHATMMDCSGVQGYPTPFAGVVVWQR